MMRRRMGRPGLVGTMARTAVIAGTASTVNRAVNQRAEQRAQDRAAADSWYAQQAAPPVPQPAAPAPAPAAAPPAAAGAGDDLMTQLQRLADLRAGGMLTDEEFAAAKAKLLA